MGDAPSTARLAEPDSRHRWRCAGCGNLTRFDVVVSRRTAEFWHVDLAGNPRVEQSSTLGAALDPVTCRWYEPQLRRDRVGRSARAGAELATDSGAGWADSG